MGDNKKINILVGIPSYSNSGSLKDCLDSVINAGANVLCLDNGGLSEVKEILNAYNLKNGVKLWHNAVNQLVNSAWNDFIRYFLSQEQYSHLIIMNDDLVMNSGWYKVCSARWLQNPNEVLLPNIVGNEELIQPVDTSIQEAKVVYEGTAGVFITMNREQAQAVYPLPAEEIRLWFGDDWIYGIMRQFWQTLVVPNLKAHHGNSVTVGSLPGKAGIIEQDKVKWREYAEPLMQERIKQLKTQQV